MDRRKLYYCNLRKNKECPKSSCRKNGGNCFLTKQKEKRAVGIRLITMWIRYHKRFNQFKRMKNRIEEKTEK